jgi:diaminopimelate epimerase
VDQDRVRIQMTDPFDLKLQQSMDLESVPLAFSSINTGVPHVVCEVEDIEAVDVVGLGRNLRYHSRFSPAGTNVNFIAPLPGGGLAIRTYERGVEDETLACGTGSVAAALIAALRHGASSPVELLTRSGETLAVHFTVEGERFSDVYLEGDARVVYAGELWADAWRYGGA